MSAEDLGELEAKTDVEEVSLPDAIQKTKKPRTQKQIEAFEKVRKIRDEKRAERKEVKEKAETEYKQQKEAKIVKKALSIKKKQILADADLDDVSEEDDIPIEVVKKIMKKFPKKSTQPKQEQVAQPVYMPTLTFI
jgi:glutamate synthase domain-containing protein 2